VALRHQIIVLERQLGKARPRFSLADRAFLAACCIGSHGMCPAGSGCWCGPRRCCAGTGTCWRAATLPDPAPGAWAGRAPSVPSACWCCAWRERIRAGVTAASTASCSSSASRSLPYRLGDPAAGRDRPGARAHLRHPSQLRPLPGRRRLPSRGSLSQRASVIVGWPEPAGGSVAVLDGDIGSRSSGALAQCCVARSASAGLRLRCRIMRPGQLASRGRPWPQVPHWGGRSR
jgi:hypothetical protein